MALALRGTFACHIKLDAPRGFCSMHSSTPFPRDRQQGIPRARYHWLQR